MAAGEPLPDTGNGVTPYLAAHTMNPRISVILRDMPNRAFARSTQNALGSNPAPRVVATTLRPPHHTISDYLPLACQ